MDERANNDDRERADAGIGRTDRRDRDGLAGSGDMLGGLSTGAGGRLGIAGTDEINAKEFEPGPISGHQHDLEDVEPSTDSATTVHSVADLPAEGV
jgi:hypothetical protein